MRRARRIWRLRWLAWPIAGILALAGYLGYLELTSGPKHEPMPASMDGFLDECGSRPVAFTVAHGLSAPSTPLFHERGRRAPAGPSPAATTSMEHRCTSYSIGGPSVQLEILAIPF
jgi:hypothetical protein